MVTWASMLPKALPPFQVLGLAQFSFRENSLRAKMKLAEILQRTLELASAVGTPNDVRSGRAASIRLCFQINSALVTSTPWRNEIRYESQSCDVRASVIKCYYQSLQRLVGPIAGDPEVPSVAHESVPRDQNNSGLIGKRILRKAGSHHQSSTWPHLTTARQVLVRYSRRACRIHEDPVLSGNSSIQRQDLPKR